MGTKEQKVKIPLEVSETVTVQTTPIRKYLEKNVEKTFESPSNPPRFPSIPQLFAKKSVLVTGATGFLGKVLVEKLLRSCPEIGEIIILQRPSESEIEIPAERRDHNIEDERYFNYIRQPVFERLTPDDLYKIRVFAGDVISSTLGLNSAQYTAITDNVSFVFNCAANVRFDDNPRNTLSANLLGVLNVLNLCKDCKKLKALVHVSTAYSFCNYTNIEEKLYPESAEPQRIIEVLRWASNNQLRPICMNYLQGRPSLYHFSKAMAETLIVQSASVPAIIVRPSIITASVKEPFPGWIDNHNGPSGFIALCGKAIVRTLLVRDGVYADWVPVDIVANTLIVAARYRVEKSFRNTAVSPLNLSISPGTWCDVPIINCTCPENNRITWREVIEICLPFLIEFPSIQVYGKPGGRVTSCPVIYNLYRLAFHYIPAAIIDGARLLTLQKPRMICFCNRFHRVMGHLEHYTTHYFFFHSPNFQLLKQQMSPEDRELFPIEQSQLNWTDYIRNYVLGVRRYYLKEDDSTLPEARIRMMRYHGLWMVLKLSSIIGLILFISALQKRGLVSSRSLLPSFTYLSSAMGFIHRKFAFSLT